MKAPTPELEALVLAYVDGRIRPAEGERLAQLLRESAEARDYFLYCLDLHAVLTTDESLAALAPSGHRATGAVSRNSAIPPLLSERASGQSQEEKETPITQGRRRSRRIRRVLSACAAVAVLLGLAALVQELLGPGAPPPGPDGREYVAVLTAAGDAVWKTDAHVPRDVGEALGLVPVELVSGRAEFQFDSGARIAIGGPAKLDFLSPLRVRLHHGRLTAFVPEPARGFTVDFPGAKVVDQGTEFAINSDGQSAAELHVFDGEISVHTDRDQTSTPLRLTANDTKKVETLRGLVEDARFESDRFLRIRREPTIPETTGDVRYLHQAPRSVLQGAFEHNAHILVFRERASLTLPEAVQVNAVAPGEYRTRREREDPPGTAVAVRVERPEEESLHTLQPGTRVSSYFVHFDPVRSGGPKGVHLRGSVRFPRPVLGVIIATRYLVPTDAVLGHPGTRYETTDYAIARNGLEPDDRMSLADDQRTVQLMLGAGTSVDHVRILVAEE